MIILVTGASGFIGKHFCDEMRRQGHQLISISRNCNTSNDFNDNIYWIQSSLDLSNETLNLIEYLKPEILVHLAWQDIPDFSKEKSHKNLESQIHFFNNLISLKSIKRIIVSGSCWEYGDSIGLCSEDNDITPLNYFIWAKKSLYNYLNIICVENNLELVWLRFFYVYGPGQKQSSLIPSLFLKLVNNEKPIILSPQDSNDFIYIDDLINAIKLVVIKDKISGIINIGSGKSTPIIEVLKLIELELFSKINYSNSNKNIPKSTNRIKNFWADIRKAKNVLCWAPSISMKDGIIKYKNHIQKS
jgi:nucleoside-diphosphate-sugar epimerase